MPRPSICSSSNLEAAMKYMFYFSMLFLFFTTSCKKEESDVIEPPIIPDPPIIELGKSSFLMNGKEWAGQLKAKTFGKTSYGDIVIRLYGSININASFAESISIIDLLSNNNKYTFGCFCDIDPFIKDGKPEILMGWVVDSDQLIGTAHIDTTYTGSYIEVLKYDSVQQTIEGRFEAHLKDREATGPNPYYPTEVHLTEGKFNLKIEQ
ncbi:MAG: hypothetical protein IT269_09540 [Saprospiraceae bacterium]|nr:hypothetical protein [Saprospiraceae bacterium]